MLLKEMSAATAMLRSLQCVAFKGFTREGQAASPITIRSLRPYSAGATEAPQAGSLLPLPRLPLPSSRRCRKHDLRSPNYFQGRIAVSDQPLESLTNGGDHRSSLDFFIGTDSQVGAGL
jgi:hypothetical protein